MSEEIIYGVAGMIFVIIIIVGIIFAVTKITEAKLKNDKSVKYEKLASDAIDLQKETTLLNKQISADLTEVKERLTSIKRILKEVE